MSSTGYAPSVAYPLSVRGFFDQPSRALWLVKWLLLIPHYIILVFLWLAFWIVTVIAFFAILFTTRYPKGLFDFNVGVIRWSWRVSFYGYAALGTDRYPPFTLSDVPDYPARLELEYPQQLNRWLPLVKWLLAFPQYLIVGALVGSGYVVATSRQDGRAVSYSTPSLIGACVLIAAIALLFTTHYPPGLFDLALGIDRWGYRLLVCGVDDRPLPAIPARSGQHRYRGPAPIPCGQRRLASRAAAGVPAGGRARIRRSSRSRIGSRFHCPGLASKRVLSCPRGGRRVGVSAVDCASLGGCGVASSRTGSGSFEPYRAVILSL